MAKEIWLWFEAGEEELAPVCFELASVGRQLSSRLSARLTAVLAGPRPQPPPPSWAGLTDKMIYLEHEGLRDSDSRACAQALVELAGQEKPLLIIFPETARTGDLPPRLSFGLRAPLATGCVEIGIRGGEWIFTRPVYSGNLYEVTAADISPIQLASLRPGSYPPAKARSDPPEVVVWRPHAPVLSGGLQVRRTFQVNPREMDISAAEVVVAGGRGVGGRENFAFLQDLADSLGGSLAGSRMAVDLGWIPFERQIGLTGKAISAKVIIAVGISGAFEFLAGIKDARAVVAVNRDPQAPIFRVADLGIAEDMEKVMPELLKRVKESA